MKTKPGAGNYSKSEMPDKEIYMRNYNIQLKAAQLIISLPTIILNSTAGASIKNPDFFRPK
ncbi:MAG: hypothetical protein ABJA66_11845 [Actinomycetota bacterium]